MWVMQEPTPVVPHSNSGLLKSIRIGRKSMPRTNTLTFPHHLWPKKKECFVKLMLDRQGPSRPEGGLQEGGP